MDALDGDSRAQFLRRAGLAGGAVIGGGALLGALAPTALAFTNWDRPPAKPFGKGDIGILNFALVLEYLEAGFYNQATVAQAQTGFLGSNEQLKTFLKAVTTDENKHVAELKSVLGGKAIKKPQFNYRGDTKTLNGFMKASYAFENEGVHAYSGQAFNIKSPQVLAAALSIVTIEARHASVIGLVWGGSAARAALEHSSAARFCMWTSATRLPTA
jgi:hypothetical protein